MQKRELSETTLHRLVLKEECSECDAGTHGKKCIHYFGCKKEVRERHTETPIQVPQFTSRFEGIIEYIG